MELQEAYKKFSVHIKQTRAASTARTYSHGFAHFIHYANALHIKDTDELTIDHFIGFVSYLIETFENKSTRSVNISAASSFKEWMIIQDLFYPSQKDDLRYKAIIKASSTKRGKKLVRAPKDEDVARVVQAVYTRKYPYLIKERNIALIEFLRSSGCRVSEVTGLNRADVDLRNRSAIVTGKGSKERRVFLSPTAIERLCLYWELAEIVGKDPAFLRHDDGGGKGRKKQRLTSESVRNLVNELVEFAGMEVEFTPHYFRHAFATLMLKQTNNLALVQDLLGHANPMSTRVYAKFTETELGEYHKDIWRD